MEEAAQRSRRENGKPVRRVGVEHPCGELSQRYWRKEGVEEGVAEGQLEGVEEGRGVMSEVEVGRRERLGAEEEKGDKEGQKERLDVSVGRVAFAEIEIIGL